MALSSGVAGTVVTWEDGYAHGLSYAIAAVLTLQATGHPEQPAG